METGEKDNALVKDRIIVITGASDGIGEAAARNLAAKGAKVVIVGRSRQKTEKVAGELKAPFYLADYSLLDDVRKLAAALKKDFPRIDVLANNAGGIMGSRALTADGNELTFQVNHLAPFLLTNLLLETLTASSAKVIATSSLAHTMAGKLGLDDIKMEHGYSAMGAYSRAKLMNILFTRELDKRFAAKGISAAAFHPGVVRTSFSSEFGGIWSALYGSFLKYLLIGPESGADTLVWLAETQPGKDWRPGGYFSKRKEAKSSAQSCNKALAEGLWELSAKLTGIK